MTDNDTTVAELKRAMADFVRSREWEKYHRPKNLAMSIAVEAGELLELFQWHDHDECDALLQRAEDRGRVADEMADLLAFILALANATGIDLASSYAAKMEKNCRKYPVEKVRGNYVRPRRNDA